MPKNEVYNKLFKKNERSAGKETHPRARANKKHMYFCYSSKRIKIKVNLINFPVIFDVVDVFLLSYYLLCMDKCVCVNVFLFMFGVSFAGPFDNPSNRSVDGGWCETCRIQWYIGASINRFVAVHWMSVILNSLPLLFPSTLTLPLDQFYSPDDFILHVGLYFLCSSFPYYKWTVIKYKLYFLPFTKCQFNKEQQQHTCAVQTRQLKVYFVWLSVSIECERECVRMAACSDSQSWSPSTANNAYLRVFLKLFHTLHVYECVWQNSINV